MLNDGGNDGAGKVEKRLKRYRFLTWLMLVVGYTGIYYSRTSLSLVTPAIKEEEGFTNTQWGTLVSAGYAAYVLGKFILGLLADRWNGRIVLLLSLSMSAILMVMFTLFQGSLAGYTISWCLSRFFQAGGWAGVMKVLAQWYPKASVGKVVGSLSLSYMLGDSVVRLSLGALLALDLEWREVIWASSGIAFAIFLLNAAFLRESPAAFNLPPVVFEETKPLLDKDGGDESDDIDPSRSLNFGSAGVADTQKVAPVPFRELMVPLLRSVTFWSLIMQSMCLTIIRETINTWSTVFFTEVLEMDDDMAAMASLFFPLAGTFSAFLGGYLVDRIPSKHRGGISATFCAFLTVNLLGIVFFIGDFTSPSTTATALGLTLISSLGLFLVAPYSFPHGVFSLQLAGPRAVGTVSSIVNGSGYAAAIGAGYITGALSDNYGWDVVFIFLTACSALCFAGCSYFWYWDTHSHKPLISSDERPLLNAAGEGDS